MRLSDEDLGLICRYLDRTLTPEEIANLESRLVEDAEFANEMARYSLTHRQIAELLREEKLHMLLEDTVGLSSSLPKEMRSGRRTSLSDSAIMLTRAQAAQLDESSQSAVRGRTFYKSLLGLAATILVVLGVVSWKQGSETPHQQDTLAAAPELSEEQPTIAATVTRLSGYTVPAGEEPLKLGDQIEAGTTLSVETGVAKLAFECGAEVTLQGPCEFFLESSMLACLKKGSITANVPRRAFTFGIRAPGIDFIDLGTDFGINVDADGNSELHVFEGEVIYRQDLESVKSTEVVHVIEDEAVLFDASTVEPSEIEINRELFARHFGLRGGSSQDSQIPVTQDLALWLSASDGVITDEQSNVLSWYDLVLGDNKTAEDAFQSNPSSRPKLVPGAINGKPGLRFDGKNDHMFTTSLETTDNQTVLMVCQFSEHAFAEDRIYGGQILNYDGPPTRELTSTLAPGVLQIGEPLLKEEFRPSLITAQVFAGFVGSTTVEAGRVDADPVGPDSPLIICYHYDFDNGVATLTLNGRPSGVARAYAPAGLTSRKVIGRHAWMELFFHGDLSELLIYNRALEQQDVNTITQHLADKYQIEIVDSDTAPKN